MNGGWRTRDDVLGDLYVATGSAPAVEELCFVSGERPPPPQARANLDEEMQIMFGDQVHQRNISNEIDKPDLKGIEYFLRMVEKSEAKSKTEAQELKPNDIYYISRLNPYVNEFVPRSHLSPNNTPHDNLTEINNNAKENMKDAVKETFEDTNTKQEHIDNHCDGDKIRPNLDETQTNGYCKLPQGEENLASGDGNLTKSDENLTKGDKKLTYGDRTRTQRDEDIESKLKDKICEAAHHNTFQHKKEKNAAIAALLKFHSKNPVKKPVKLYTPEFFANAKATEFKGADDDSSQSSSEANAEKNDESNKVLNEEKSQEGKVNDVKVQNNNYVKLHDVKNIESKHFEEKVQNNIQLQEKLPKQFEENKYCKENLQDNRSFKENRQNYINNKENKIEISNNISDKDEIQKSIDKVTDWFKFGVKHKPKSVKSPEPILNTAQIGYKRKETKSPASTNSSSIIKKIPRPVENYKPSEHAKELRDKYAARSKEMETKQTKTLWDKLDLELKKKEAELLKKVEEDNNI